MFHLKFLKDSAFFSTSYYSIELEKPLLPKKKNVNPGTIWRKTWVPVGCGHVVPNRASQPSKVFWTAQICSPFLSYFSLPFLYLQSKSSKTILNNRSKCTVEHYVAIPYLPTSTQVFLKICPLAPLSPPYLRTSSSLVYVYCFVFKTYFNCLLIILQNTCLNSLAACAHGLQLILRGFGIQY